MKLEMRTNYERIIWHQIVQNLENNQIIKIQPLKWF